MEDVKHRNKKASSTSSLTILIAGHQAEQRNYHPQDAIMNQ
jgi:hypothetical protein